MILRDDVDGEERRGEASRSFDSCGVNIISSSCIPSRRFIPWFARISRVPENASLEMAACSFCQLLLALMDDGVTILPPSLPASVAPSSTLCTAS